MADFEEFRRLLGEYQQAVRDMENEVHNGTSPEAMNLARDREIAAEVKVLAAYNEVLAKIER